METKITLVYSTSNDDCYQVSGSLVAWITKGKHGASVLFGYECEASDRGFQEARITGLLLRTKDIEFLKNLIESQTDGDIFGDSLHAARIGNFRLNLKANHHMGHKAGGCE